MGLSVFMAFSVDGVVMTLSGVQMARFIYGMALWCLLDKGPAIIEFVNNTANTKEGTNGQT